jgi:hypothetical protein
MCEWAFYSMARLHFSFAINFNQINLQFKMNNSIQQVSAFVITDLYYVNNFKET